MHSCNRCLTEAIPERCPLFRFDWEEDDPPPWTREDPNRSVPSENAVTTVNRKTKSNRKTP